MSDFEQYEHHGKMVWVRTDLRGRHRDHCLCYQCGRFIPDGKGNCPRAGILFNFCKTWDMVTPVWECPDFKKRSEE